MVQPILVFCYVLANLIVRIKSKTIVVYPNVVPVYLKSGGFLDLLCRQSDGFKVVWSKSDFADPHRNHKVIHSAKETGFFTTAHDDGMSYMRLFKHNVSSSDSGSYKCAVQSGADLPYIVDVHVLQVGSQDGLATHAGNTSSVACSLLNTDIRPEIRWFKSDVEVHGDSPASTSSSKSKYQSNVTLTETSTESILTIRNIGEADVGEYICLFQLDGEHRFNNSVTLYSHPQIKPMGRSKNLAEGKVLDLNCKAWGWPEPNVSWSREVEDYSSSDFPSDPLWMDRRVSFPTNTSLRIDPIASSDRAVYVCHAATTINATYIMAATSSILVRVRGKFAPLLPLVGILIELVVLFIIIYVYERKRTQEREEQERNEAVGNQFNSVAQGRRASSGEGGGRHRKSR